MQLVSSQLICLVFSSNNRKIRLNHGMDPILDLLLTMLSQLRYLSENKHYVINFHLFLKQKTKNTKIYYLLFYYSRYFFICSVTRAKQARHPQTPTPLLWSEFFVKNITDLNHTLFSKNIHFFHKRCYFFHLASILLPHAHTHTHFHPSFLKFSLQNPSKKYLQMPPNSDPFAMVGVFF